VNESAGEKQVTEKSKKALYIENVSFSPKIGGG